MSGVKYQKYLNNVKHEVARRIRVLRIERRFTQKDLAARLGLSQGRLSEIERGDGSFTAEQFLLLLSLFNVTASHFAPPTHDQEAELQNALARFGAAHLHVIADVLPTERFEEVVDVVRGVLLAESPRPRHLTALAPVLVRNIDRVTLSTLRADLVHAGRDRRLSWIADNTLAAVRQELAHPQLRPVAQRYRRAQVVLATFLEFSASCAKDAGVAPQDLLDATISSAKTRGEVTAASSALSKRWGIVTDLQPEDFVEALRAAYAQP
jgi:transcriptional regulator with XRE-family HTH domain